MPTKLLTSGKKSKTFARRLLGKTSPPESPVTLQTAVALAPEPLRLHPNPTAAGINLEAQREVSVYNSLDQLVLVVKADGPTRIDLSLLPAGIYVVCTGSRVVKVVKN